MRQTLIGAITLVVLIWTIGISVNAEATGAIQKEIVGEILSANTSANSLTVRTKKGEMTFRTDTKTQIMSGKEEIHLSDLRPGQKVKVHYIQTGGTELAQRVMVKVNTKKR